MTETEGEAREMRFSTWEEFVRWEEERTAQRVVPSSTDSDDARRDDL